MDQFRKLYLLRHAKSRWDELGRSDFERSLAPRGIKAAKKMGTYLRENHPMPELVLCSSAIRAAQTWDLAIADWPQVPMRKDMKSLYMASPARLAGILARQSDTVTSILMVAHNPGMHGFALQLAGDDAPQALIENMPTAALAVLELPGPNWADIAAAKLIDYAEPRKLGKA